jgi:hypothetical protein
MQTATATVTKPTAFAKPAAAQFSNAGIIWLKLAVLYLVLGISVGIGMGAIAPVLAISEIIGAVAIVAFAANLFINLKN